MHVSWCCFSCASCLSERIEVHFQLVALATALRAVSDAVTQWPKHSSALHHPTTSPSPSPHAAFFHTSLSFVLDTHQIFRFCILLLFSLSPPPLSSVLIGLQDFSLQLFLTSSSFQGFVEKSHLAGGRSAHRCPVSSIVFVWMKTDAPFMMFVLAMLFLFFIGCCFAFHWCYWIGPLAVSLQAPGPDSWALL